MVCLALPKAWKRIQNSATDQPMNRALPTLFALGLVTISLGACRSAPEEPTAQKGTLGQVAAGGSATPVTAARTTAVATGDGGLPIHVSPDDPLKGIFTLADATKDMKGKGPIVATIETSKGALQCKLFDDKAPNTVANFIGLAKGTRTWKDPKSKSWVNKPAYDGTTFHRIIKGFMIQGGDQNGNGSGEPGYVINDEIWEGAKHDRAGLLCMANRGHHTNGAQFFITDAAAAHLDGNYTIFGECAPVDVVHQIASVELAGEKPTTPVVIKKVTVTRDEAAK